MLSLQSHGGAWFPPTKFGKPGRRPEETWIWIMVRAGMPPPWAGSSIHHFSLPLSLFLSVTCSCHVHLGASFLVLLSPALINIPSQYGLVLWNFFMNEVKNLPAGPRQTHLGPGSLFSNTSLLLIYFQFL